MEITDSHCHIDKMDLSAFGGSIKSMLAHAKKLSVTNFLCVCINLENFEKVLSLAEEYNCIFASVGVHPTEQNGQEPSIEDLIKLADNKKIIAIGETGLDYFHIKKTDATWQRERFIKHIAVSKKIKKPLIIHTRDAKHDTIKIMRTEQACSGVMHCFSEDWDTAKKALDLGFYISFSGIVTFKNATSLREIAKKIPDNRLLIETDAPYLTPTPYRGKPNSPAYTYYVAQELAKVRGTTIDNIAKITSQNFKKLFSHA